MSIVFFVAAFFMVAVALWLGTVGLLAWIFKKLAKAWRV